MCRELKKIEFPKKVLYMNLESRLRGRPRNRWQDEVREDGRLVGGKGWKERVYNGWNSWEQQGIIAFCTCRWNEWITTSNTQPISLYPTAAQITPVNVSDSYIPTLLSESNYPITVITGTNSNWECRLGGRSALLGRVAVRNNATTQNTHQTIHWCEQWAAG